MTFGYGGASYADSYMSWSSPGPFSHGDVGYEHDLIMYPSFADLYSAWTNLPYGYDDCPTFGYQEGSQWSAAFGSFHINKVAAGTYYMGTWDLRKNAPGTTLPPSGSTAAALNGQEVEHRSCWFDNIWCMDGIRSQPLTGGFTLVAGSTTYRSW